MIGKLQRSAAAGVTETLQITPSDDLDVVSHILPLDLHILFIAADSERKCRSIFRDTFGGKVAEDRLYESSVKKNDEEHRYETSFYEQVEEG